MSASAGTLVAAAMESAGYAAQAQVLANFTDFLGAWTFLIMLGAMIVILWAFILEGNLDRAIWMLIGPALFFFMTQRTSEAVGVEWQFGDFKSDSVPMVSTQLGTGPSKAQVSWLFHLWNRVVSSTFQNIIAQMDDNEVRTQLKFTSRAKIMERVTGAEIGTPGLKALINVGLQGECSEFYHAARTIAMANRNKEMLGTPAHQDAQANFQRLFTKRSHRLEGNTVARDYVQNMILGGWRRTQPAQTAAFIDRYCTDKLAGSGVPGSPTADLKANFTSQTPEQVLSNPISCQQIWCWSWMGLYDDAEALMTLSARGITDLKDASKGGEFTAERNQAIQEIWEDISVKFQDPGDTPIMPGDPVQKVTPDVSIIPMVIGGLLLRKELTKDPRASGYSQFAEHSGAYIKTPNFNYKMTDDEIYWATIKRNQHSQAKAYQYEAFSLAMNLPYVQGFILYVLALGFPFVCILLLIPSKIEMFLMWFGAWMWVKSWDLGFAMVMIAEDFLWELMPHGSYYSLTTDPNNSPTSILESAFDGDPAYSLSTYYVLLALMLSSVPVVTGKMFSRVSGVFNKWIQGVGEIAKMHGYSADLWTTTEMSVEADYLRHEQDAAFVKKQIESGMMPFPQMKALLNKEDEIRKGSNGWLSSALGVGGAGLLGSGAIAAAGGPVTMAAGVGAAALASTKALLDKGISDQRLANGNQVNLIMQQGQVSALGANRDRSREVAQMISSGTNQRILHVPMNDVPAGSIASLVEQQKRLDAEQAKLQGQVTGGLVGSAVGAAAGGAGLVKAP